jgi:ribonuclease Z
MVRFMSAITFLGTSGSVVTRERMCAGILFQDKLIDVGFGVLTNLVRSKVKLDSINDIFISHTHSDHIGDFTGLIWAMAMENRTKRVRVVSSPSVAAVLQKILELQATPHAWLKFKIEYVTPENAHVKSTKTIHDPETLAYRFEIDGSDFVYGGDSARSKKLGEFARDCDLLIHDATFLDGQESIAALTKHATANDAGRTAKLARARRLVLTHIAPSNAHREKKYRLEAAATFDGEILVAKDQLTIRS